MLQGEQVLAPVEPPRRFDRGVFVAKYARLNRQIGRWLPAAAFIAVMAMALHFLSYHTIADVDTWHELALFREALRIGWVPSEDVFAYTPTVSPSVHHEWATGAVLYAIVVGTGLGGTGLVLLRMLLVGAIAFCCFWHARRAGATLPTIVWLTPPAFFLSQAAFSPVRAQLFTLLFLSILLLFLQEDRKGRRWWIPAWLVLYVVWLNMHAGFVVGAGLFSLYAMGRLADAFRARRPFGEAIASVRHLILVGIAMCVLPLLNPYGSDYLPYLWHAIRMDRPLIKEWQPLWDVQHNKGRVQLLAILAVTVLAGTYALCRGSRRQFPELLLLAGCAYLGLRHTRHISIYALFWISYLPAHLEATELGRLMRRVWERWPVALVLCSLMYAGLAFREAVRNRIWDVRVPNAGESMLYYPVGATEYLAAQGFSGNLMVPFNQGAYVLWNLHPSVNVSMDSRYEVAYPEGALEENVRFYHAEIGWQECLSQYSTDAILARRSDPVAVRLDSGDVAGWRRVYRDDGFAIYARAEIARALPRVERTGQEILGDFEPEKLRPKGTAPPFDSGALVQVEEKRSK